MMRFRMMGCVLLSGVVAGCGSDAEAPADGDVFMELDGEAFYLEAEVGEAGSACEMLRESRGDDVADSCLANALIVVSRAVGDDETIGEQVAINVGLCRGLSAASSVDLGDPERSCQPSALLVTTGHRVLAASSGSIDVTVTDEDADVLIDGMVDDPNDPDDLPIRVQAHLILQR